MQVKMETSEKQKVSRGRGRDHSASVQAVKMPRGEQKRRVSEARNPP